MIRFLALFLSASAFAHPCVDAGIVVAPSQWSAYTLGDESGAVVWKAPGIAKRTDGKTTPLFVVYCTTGATPVAGTLQWLDGESDDKPVENLQASVGATLILPGATLTLP